LRFLEPAEHDGLVAGVSHLPFLAAIALMETVVSNPTWGDASPLASTGFRDVTRLAAGSPEMYRDICLTNSAAVTRWLDEYIETLQQLRQRVATHDRSMEKLFVRAQQSRQQWSATQDGLD
jgi:prephenate dehydrogenase